LSSLSVSEVSGLVTRAGIQSVGTASGLGRVLGLGLTLSARAADGQVRGKG
jgi:hypothetical protein